MGLQGTDQGVSLAIKFVTGMYKTNQGSKGIWGQDSYAPYFIAAGGAGVGALLLVPATPEIAAALGLATLEVGGEALVGAAGMALINIGQQRLMNGSGAINWGQVGTAAAFGAAGPAIRILGASAALSSAISNLANLAVTTGNVKGVPTLVAGQRVRSNLLKGVCPWSP
jgi:hypothetical protein